MQTKKVWNFDWLCFVLVLFAVFCLCVSIPATFQLVNVTHDGWSAVLALAVIEIMAFFSLLAPLVLSQEWATRFRRISLPLLAATTIGNFAAGWTFLWANQTLPNFYKELRDVRVFGVYPIAFILVALLSAAVPYGMKFFIDLAVQRYRENKMGHTPQAAADEALRPLMVHLAVAKSMQEAMQDLGGNVPRYLHGPQGLMGPPGTPGPGPSQDQINEAVQSALREQEKQTLFGANYGVEPDAPPRIVPEIMVEQLGHSPDEVTTFYENLKKEGEARAKELGLEDYSGTPKKNAVTWDCFGCGKEGTNAEKGAAVRWAKKYEQPEILCKACRDKDGRK